MDVLKLFEGLTKDEANELRRRIIETLPALRKAVTDKRAEAKRTKDGKANVKKYR
jgi:hypothetical protein